MTSTRPSPSGSRSCATSGWSCSGATTRSRVAAVAALSGGHLLIEDVPGVGKTVLARALATSLGAELSRVQGHPDLLPSDVTGVSVFAPDTGTLGVPARPGVRPRRARRRAQPHAAAHPGRASRDDGGAAGQRGRRVVAAPAPAPRDRHPEPASPSSAPTRSSRASSTGSPWRRRSAIPTPTPRRSSLQHGGGKFALGELRPVCTTEEWLRGPARHRVGRRCAERSPSTRWRCAAPAGRRRACDSVRARAPRSGSSAPPRPTPCCRPSLRHARRRQGGGRGVPGAPSPHRRGCRAGRRPWSEASSTPHRHPVHDRPGRPGAPAGSAVRRRRIVRPVPTDRRRRRQCAGVLLAWGSSPTTAGPAGCRRSATCLRASSAWASSAPAVVARPGPGGDRRRPGRRHRGPARWNCAARGHHAGAGAARSTHPGPRPSSGPRRARAGRPDRRDARHPRPGAAGRVRRAVDRWRSPPRLPSACMWWRKTVVVDLPRALHVGPAAGPAAAAARRARGHRRRRILDASVPIGEPRGACALPARRPPALGALARHRPQRGADGARDGGADRRARDLEVRLPVRPRRRPSAWRSGPWHRGGARRPGGLGAAGDHRGRRAEGPGRRRRPAQCRRRLARAVADGRRHPRRRPVGGGRGP